MSEWQIQYYLEQLNQYAARAEAAYEGALRVRGQSETLIGVALALVAISASLIAAGDLGEGAYIVGLLGTIVSLPLVALQARQAWEIHRDCGTIELPGPMGLPPREIADLENHVSAERTRLTQAWTTTLTLSRSIRSKFECQFVLLLIQAAMAALFALAAGAAQAFG